MRALITFILLTVFISYAGAQENNGCSDTGRTDLILVRNYYASEHEKPFWYVNREEGSWSKELTPRLALLEYMRKNGLSIVICEEKGADRTHTRHLLWTSYIKDVYKGVEYRVTITKKE